MHQLVRSSYYHFKSGITKEVSEAIQNSFKENELAEKSMVYSRNEMGVTSSIRECKNFWIPNTHWISGMMFHFVNVANQISYNFDLQMWCGDIQYTIYEGSGTYYDWHTDFSPDFNKDFVRKLSISLMLSSSDDYEGGELELDMGKGDNKNVKFKLDIGDLVVFPSNMWHKVNTITSGKRVCLVGWFGGPPFK